MKKIFFSSLFLIILLGELIGLFIFSYSNPEFSLDTIEVNEVLQSVTMDFNFLDNHQNYTSLDYVVLDSKGAVIFRTKQGLSESEHAAISHRDTILTIEQDQQVLGKILIYNTQSQIFMEEKQRTILIFSISILFQVSLWFICAFTIYSNILKPFKNLKGFAQRVAGGNLDIPLTMDRYNLFGAFTESFDIMRSELKLARSREIEAQKSKKELVAKLSHDIKTPVASIKALAEVGYALASTKKEKERFQQIVGKTDQINTLITNLFTSTLEELQELTVTPAYMESSKLKEVLQNADYLHRSTIPEIPQCLVFVDIVRLQQVLDNIFANSYKYANTAILVAAMKNEEYLEIIVEDYGGGVPEEELTLIKEKFKRGSNVKQIEGAGLGLYISDYFMQKMKGSLVVENGIYGLKITISLALNC